MPDPLVLVTLSDKVVYNGDIEQLAYSAREFRKVYEGVKILIGNFFRVLVLVVSLPSLKV